MDVKKTRIENMEVLAKQAGSVSALARMLGISPNYLYQLRSGSGDRTMGDRIARQIEEVMGKDYGWMDQRHSHDAPGTEMNAQLTLVKQSTSCRGLSEELIEQAIRDAEAVTAGSDLTPAQKAKVILNILRTLQAGDDLCEENAG